MRGDTSPGGTGCRVSAGLLVLGLLAGCTRGPYPQDPSWKLVPITDASVLVGEWEGLVKKEHDTFPGASVRLMIRSNNTYLFAGQTASKFAVGSGDIEPRDGRLVGETEARAVTFTIIRARPWYTSNRPTVQRESAFKVNSRESNEKASRRRFPHNGS